MTSLRIRHRMAMFALFAFAPALANAQDPVHTLRDLQPRLRLNETVRVEELGGNHVQGKVESVSESALTIKVKGKSREFRESQLLSVEKRYDDPVKNGVILGAAIGGAAGAIIGVVVSDVFCDGCGNYQGGGALTVGALGAGIGAGTGALSDWLRKGYRTEFSMPRTADRRFHVAPILSRTTKVCPWRSDSE